MKWQFPNIEVELLLEATHSPIELLLDNKLDIALTSSKPNHKHLIGIPIFNDQIYALVHKDHELAKETFITPEDFKENHLIIHSYPLKSVSVYNKFLKPNHIDPAQISAIPLTEVALEMIEANIGITCFPKWALEKLNISQDITFLPLGKSGLKRTHYLVTRAEDQTKKYIADFTHQFIAKFQK